MAGCGAAGVRGQQCFFEEGGIANNGIERTIGAFQCLQRGVPDAYALGERRGRHVLTSLLHRSLVDIDAQNVTGRETLCQHQGYQSAASADVEYVQTIFQWRPSTQEHTVGSHFHGTAVMLDAESLELEPRVAHIGLG